MEEELYCAMAVIIDGKKIAQDIRQEVKEEATRLRVKTGIAPGLGVILVGDDPASKIYLRHKENACKDAGFLSREFRLPRKILLRMRCSPQFRN